jgi:metal-dependent amidase/aminoacylase/carboxypeptidase family protein
MQQLQERAKAEKLSAATLKEIADGYLAKEKLKSNQTDVKKASKKAEAQAVQKLAETKKTAPTTPKVAAAAPSTSEDISSMSWLDTLRSASKGK